MATIQQLIPFSSSELVLLHDAIELWYQHHGRKELPWRNTEDPYAIYVSEVMLQQTQVQTVLDRFYFPFLEAFPTLEALAKAPREKVTKYWQGLGYYNRAHNLHKAAQQCAPQLPTTIDTLMELPGIGKNTAHAIAAFAYHQPVPVMEANLKRVLSRFFALSSANDATLWDYAYALVNRHSPFNYNQAMMDIGATICTKATPSCLLCPLAKHCQGKQAPHKYPPPKVKKATPVRYKNILVFHDNYTHFTMSARTTRFLHGLYHFTEIPRENMKYQLRNSQYTLEKKAFIGNIQQSYSHFTLDADIYLLEQTHYSVDTEPSVIDTLEKLQTYPMSQAEVKIIALIEKYVSSFQEANLAQDNAILA